MESFLPQTRLASNAQEPSDTTFGSSPIGECFSVLKRIAYPFYHPINGPVPFAPPYEQRPISHFIPIAVRSGDARITVPGLI